MPLHFLPRYPFSPAHQKALTSLLTLFPKRFQALETYISQVSEREWKHGTYRGFTDTSGNVELKEGQWWRIRGLAIHELGHAYHYRLITGKAWSDWELFWAKHKREMGTSYGEKNADEGFSEAVVGVLKPGLGGYGKLPKVVADYVRGLLK